jgi:hypothetical protein
MPQDPSRLNSLILQCRLHRKLTLKISLTPMPCADFLDRWFIQDGLNRVLGTQVLGPGCTDRGSRVYPGPRFSKPRAETQGPWAEHVRWVTQYCSGPEIGPDFGRNLVGRASKSASGRPKGLPVGTRCGHIVPKGTRKPRSSVPARS